MALLDGVPKEVVACIGAVSTMMAAAASFLKSADRRQIHEKTSRGFRSLLVKMISCESESDYEKYLADFNGEIMDEPIMPKKYAKNFKMRFTMTPELREVTDYYCTRCLSSCFRKVNLCSRFSLRSRIAHVIFRNITYVALTKNMADTCVRLASRPGLCQTYIGVRLLLTLYGVDCAY